MMSAAGRLPFFEETAKVTAGYYMFDLLPNFGGGLTRFSR